MKNMTSQSASINTRHFFRAISMTSPGRWQMTLAAAVLLAVFAGKVWAFPSYDGCEDCHGDFSDGMYTSRQDGTSWGTTLMQGHEPFVGNSCNACHKSGGFGEVFLNASDDATLSKSCVGCHGRDEDVNGSCTGLSGSQGGVEEECGSAAGLRQYHESQVGTGTCNGCHSGDAAPVGEHIAPFNYGMSGVDMQDSCDADGSESQFGDTGLDNDGDGQRDGDDPDCQTSTFMMDAGLNGNWWNGLDRNGEGVQVEVSDGGNGSLTFVATIYSYDDMGNQIFLIAVGTVNGDTVEVDVFITEGGLWGDDYDPSLVVESEWGSGTFTASSCEAMHMSLMPNAAFQGMGYTDLMYDLMRLTTPAAPCPAEVSN
jgi:predicted CXXCH cytochrome family protein